MRWLDHKKIDAHVHVLPGERAAQFLANEGPEAPWSRCGAEDYLRRMDRYHIEKALLLPANDQYLYYRDPDETNRFLGGLVRQYPDRLIFGTDFPDGDYDAYFTILDQMDFTDGEIDRIAWKNIAGLLTPEGAG